MKQIKTVRLLKSLLFAIGSLLILPSCNNSENESDSLSKSKETFNGFVSDARRNVDFKEVMRKYYYKPEELLNDELFFQFFEAEYIYLMENLRKSNDSLFYFWNEEVENVDYYDWLNEDGFCKEAVLILFSKKPKQRHRLTFCLNEEGLIYSNINLTNHDIDTIVWVRNQPELINKEKATSKEHLSVYTLEVD